MNYQHVPKYCIHQDFNGSAVHMFVARFCGRCNSVRGPMTPRSWRQFMGSWCEHKMVPTRHRVYNSNLHVFWGGRTKMTRLHFLLELWYAYYAYTYCELLSIAFPVISSYVIDMMPEIMPDVFSFVSLNFPSGGDVWCNPWCNPAPGFTAHPRRLESLTTSSRSWGWAGIQHSQQSTCLPGFFFLFFAGVHHDEQGPKISENP